MESALPLRHALLLCILVTVLSARNILFVPLTGEGSHYYVMEFIAKELVARGNDVTMLLTENFKDSVLSSAEAGQDQRVGGPSIHFEFYKAGLTRSDYEEFIRNMTSAGLEGKYNDFMMNIIKTSDIPQKLRTECSDLLGNSELMLRLRDSNFDLTLVDYYMQCPFVQYFRKHMGIKFAVIVPTLTLPSNAFIESRSPLNPSYMPQYTSGFDHALSFNDRIANVAYAIFNIVLYSSMYSVYAELGVEYGIPDLSFIKIFANAEVWLVNNHFAFDFPRPVLPNHVAVGGLTTHPAAPLDSEWEEFLQSAGDEGVVLFSMGSYASGIDGDVAAMFAGAFAQLPQKVIWKSNGSPAAKLTPNVKVVDWIPQNDLLGDIVYRTEHWTELSEKSLVKEILPAAWSPRKHEDCRVRICLGFQKELKNGI